jgi:hypothetical protein
MHTLTSRITCGIRIVMQDSVFLRLCFSCHYQPVSFQRRAKPTAPFSHRAGTEQQSMRGGP